MKSCNFFKEGDGSGGSFSTVAIQSLLWALYYFTLLRLSRLKFWLQLCAVIKFRAKLKAAQLANFPLMSRHIIVCRDISKLWEDKLSPGGDIRHFMTLLSCRNLTTLLKELLLSRPKCSVATLISFTTKLLVATSPLFFLQY